MVYVINGLVLAFSLCYLTHSSPIQKNKGYTNDFQLVSTIFDQSLFSSRASTESANVIQTTSSAEIPTSKNSTNSVTFINNTILSTQMPQINSSDTQAPSIQATQSSLDLNTTTLGLDANTASGTPEMKPSASADPEDTTLADGAGQTPTESDSSSAPDGVPSSVVQQQGLTTTKHDTDVSHSHDVATTPILNPDSTVGGIGTTKDVAATTTSAVKIHIQSAGLWQQLREPIEQEEKENIGTRGDDLSEGEEGMLGSVPLVLIACGCFLFGGLILFVAYHLGNWRKRQGYRQLHHQ